jgi:UDP-N-acetylmuramoylalanine--D-glutamate ligase
MAVLTPVRSLDALDFAGKRCTVVGLGIEGVDLARFLAHRGADVTVTDSKPASALAEQLREIDGLGIQLSLGGNDVAVLTGADAVFVSQGVPLELPGLTAVKDAGIPMHSMMGLFFKLSTGPIAGITGSSGKTTTTALVGAMFRADERPSFVGGNIGVGLLDQLEMVRPYTWAVLEVSHTQLQLVDSSPHVAAVLNVTPNHLDRFSWEEYRALKANIIRYQEPRDVAVLNYDDSEVRALAPSSAGRTVWFSMTDGLPGDGVFVRDGLAIARLRGFEEPLFALDSVRLRGVHNQANAVAAAAIAIASGISPDAIEFAVHAFTGVPHRLELVGTVAGADYYNDSIATSPERTIAGLRSFDRPAVLLLGGRDKHLPLEELVAEAGKRCRAVILFGEAAPKLAEAFTGTHLRLLHAGDLEDAVNSAADEARDGEVVLLSPACASYDAYDNFERRGEHFRSLVAQLGGAR